MPRNSSCIRVNTVRLVCHGLEWAFVATE